MNYEKLNNKIYRYEKETVDKVSELKDLKSQLSELEDWHIKAIDNIEKLYEASKSDLETQINQLSKL